jgi:hypothetical protein
MQSALAHGLELPGERRKHTALEQDREQQILDWIKSNVEGSTPVTRKEIKDYCIGQLQVPVTRGWVNSFVLRDPDEIIQAEVSPKKSSVCTSRECSSNEQCRISMNMFRAVQLT